MTNIQRHKAQTKNPRRKETLIINCDMITGFCGGIIINTLCKKKNKKKKKKVQFWKGKLLFLSFFFLQVCVSLLSQSFLQTEINETTQVRYRFMNVSNFEKLILKPKKIGSGWD